MENLALANTALDQIGIGEEDVDLEGEEEEDLVGRSNRRAYSDPELREAALRGSAEMLGEQVDQDGPRELTEDEYQEFLEDSECLVENGDVEPELQFQGGRGMGQRQDPEGEGSPAAAHGFRSRDLPIGRNGFQGHSEPRGSRPRKLTLEPEGDEDAIAEEGEDSPRLKKLAPNMGDISPLDEYPPLGGFLGGEGEEDDVLSEGSEPREGSPEPDRCFPPHPDPHPPGAWTPPRGRSGHHRGALLPSVSSDEDEDLMPADTADSVENVLDESTAAADDSVEHEAVAQLRSQPKYKVKCSLRPPATAIPFELPEPRDSHHVRDHNATQRVVFCVRCALFDSGGGGGFPPCTLKKR